MRGCLLGVMVAVGVVTAAFAGDSSSGGGSGRPPGGPGGGEMKPPQEAITACSGKTVGDTCQAGKAGEGVCEYTPDKKYFACKPNKMPSGGPGSGPGDDRSGSSSQGGSTLVK